jgi:hypothetical protein
MKGLCRDQLVLTLLEFCTTSLSEESSVETSLGMIEIVMIFLNGSRNFCWEAGLPAALVHFYRIMLTFSSVQRSLFCFWAVRKLEISLTKLARRLGMSPAGVGYAVQRGKIIARENGWHLDL